MLMLMPGLWPGPGLVSTLWQHCVLFSFYFSSLDLVSCWAAQEFDPHQQWCLNAKIVVEVQSAESRVERSVFPPWLTHGSRIMEH